MKPDMRVVATRLRANRSKTLPRKSNVLPKSGKYGRVVFVDRHASVLNIAFAYRRLYAFFPW